jgi:hypothetical protein
MLYFGDDEIIIGFSPSDQEPDKVLKKINNIIGMELVPMESNNYDDVGTFENDTIIINSNLFDEDFLELLEYGIYIHIVDY